MKADGTRCDCLLPCRLEAEIKEAQVRAKEEMMQGIQIVKEMAQQELSSQKAAYESKIKVLEAELVGGRAVFLPHQGVPSELRILGGPGASRGKRGLRGRGDTEGLHPRLRPRLSCLLDISFPAPSRGQCSGGWASGVVLSSRSVNLDEVETLQGPFSIPESISCALILKMELLYFFDVVFQELFCIFALFVC